MPLPHLCVSGGCRRSFHPLQAECHNVRMPPWIRPRRTRGHIHLDLVILVFIVLAALSFVNVGMVKGSWLWFLFGAWGLTLGAGFIAALPAALLFELLRKKETEAGLVLLGVVPAGLAGAAGAFATHRIVLAQIGFALGLAAGAFLAVRADRLPPRLSELGELLTESVMLTALAYVLVPFALFLFSALVLPFFEHGFGDGLKIAGVMGTMTAAVLGFFWALNTVPVVARLAVSAVMFGLLFAFAAFLTLLLFPFEGASTWKVYAVLGAEAAVCAGVTWMTSMRGDEDA